MAISLLLSLFLLTLTSVLSTNLYLFPTTLSPDYQNMLTTFKIYAYSPAKPFTFADKSLSLFRDSLLQSSFLTQNPYEAHLFFVPFSPDLSKRSLARLIRELRVIHPFWNRTLGADHFFLSPTGIDFSSDRNVVELKKNAVQISVFPTTSGNFIPHKDITLPPVNNFHLALTHATVNKTKTFLGYMKWDGITESVLVNELNGASEFVVGTEQSDHTRRLEESKYCLFVDDGEMSWMAEAMASGCVPAVITGRPIQDLPLIDVLAWSEMAVFVGKGIGVGELKRVLGGIGDDEYDRMREMGAAASRHLVWNKSPQEWDAFRMVIYQLWSRRHTIRYARRQ